MQYICHFFYTNTFLQYHFTPASITFNGRLITSNIYITKASETRYKFSRADYCILNHCFDTAAFPPMQISSAFPPSSRAGWKQQCSVSLSRVCAAWCCWRWWQWGSAGPLSPCRVLGRCLLAHCSHCFRFTIGTRGKRPHLMYGLYLGFYSPDDSMTCFKITLLL